MPTIAQSEAESTPARFGPGNTSARLAQVDVARWELSWLEAALDEAFDPERSVGLDAAVEQGEAIRAVADAAILAEAARQVAAAP